MVTQRGPQTHSGMGWDEEIVSSWEKPLIGGEILVPSPKDLKPFIKFKDEGVGI